MDGASTKTAGGRAAGRTGRRRLGADERREQLLRSAEDVLAERGMAGTTVPQVVAGAGLAQGSFYRYFKNIDDAVVQLTRTALGPVREAAFALDFSSVQTPQQLEHELLRFYRVLAGQLSRHPALVAEAFLAGSFAPGALGKEMSAFLDAMQEHAHRVAVRQMARPPFRDVDPKIFAAAIVGMIIGAVRAAVQLKGEFDPEQWAVEMARLEAGALVQRDDVASTTSEE